MKKYNFLILAFVLILSLAACNQQAETIISSLDEPNSNLYYDDHADMWKIVFLTVAHSEDDTWATTGNCQSVYMNSDGITQLIVYGE